MPSPRKEAAFEPGASAALGTLAVAGWLTHDLAVFTTSGEPAVVLGLLPGSLLALVTGALLGMATVNRWALSGVLALSGIAALLISSSVVAIGSPQSLIPQVVLLIGLALSATVWARRRWDAEPLRSSFATGLLASSLFTFLHYGMLAQSWALLPLALALIALSMTRSSSLRRWATVVVALVPIVWLGLEGLAAQRLPRPDTEPTTLNRRAGTPDGPSLLLIVLDTVRADRLAPYGSSRVTTPGIDRFAERHTTRFDQARSTASWTLPSHASLLTGLMPAQHGATMLRAQGDGFAPPEGPNPAHPLASDAPTLAERLERAGYRTSAIIANAAYLHHAFGLDRGFHHYDDRVGSLLPTREYAPLAQLTGQRGRLGRLAYRDARTITDLGLEWLAAHDEEQPFFLLLNYMDAHMPCMPPPPFDRAFVDRRLDDPLAPPPPEMQSLQYDRAIAYLDTQVTRLLDSLDRSGLLENTVVIITSDHGEAFGEHGFRSHGRTLYEEVIRVPLYVKPVGRQAEAVDERPINSSEILDLALAELGLAETPEPWSRPITAEFYGARQRRLLYPEDIQTRRDLVTWLDGSRKIVVSSTGAVEAFDVLEDPTELRPLPLTEEEMAAAREHARLWWYANPPPLEQPRQLDPEEERRLRALGYLN